MFNPRKANSFNKKLPVMNVNFSFTSAWSFSRSTILGRRRNFFSDTTKDLTVKGNIRIPFENVNRSGPFKKALRLGVEAISRHHDPLVFAECLIGACQDCHLPVMSLAKQGTDSFLTEAIIYSALESQKTCDLLAELTTKLNSTNYRKNIVLIVGGPGTIGLSEPAGLNRREYHSLTGISTGDSTQSQLLISAIESQPEGFSSLCQHLVNAMGSISGNTNPDVQTKIQQFYELINAAGRKAARMNNSRPTRQPKQPRQMVPFQQPNPTAHPPATKTRRPPSKRGHKKRTNPATNAKTGNNGTAKRGKNRKNPRGSVHERIGLLNIEGKNDVDKDEETVRAEDEGGDATEVETIIETEENSFRDGRTEVEDLRTLTDEEM